MIKGLSDHKYILVATLLIITIALSIGVYSSRLPVNASDTGTWGTTLNDYLTTLAGANATDLNQTKVGANNINASVVNTTHIVDGTIAAGDLAASSVNTTHIVEGTILLGDLAPSSVNTTHIVAGTITSGDLAAASVHGITHIIAGTIPADALAPSSVNTTHLVANTIDAVDLANTILLDANLVFNDDAGFNFTVDNNDLFVDTTNSRVGIGTGSPATTLHVEGVFRITPQASPPTPTGQGDIYIDTSGAFCYYNITPAWENLAAGGTCA